MDWVLELLSGPRVESTPDGLAEHLRRNLGGLVLWHDPKRGDHGYWAFRQGQARLALPAHQVRDGLDLGRLGRETQEALQGLLGDDYRELDRLEVLVRLRDSSGRTHDAVFGPEFVAPRRSASTTTVRADAAWTLSLGGRRLSLAEAGQCKVLEVDGVVLECTAVAEGIEVFWVGDLKVERGGEALDLAGSGTLCDGDVLRAGELAGEVRSPGSPPAAALYDVDGRPFENGRFGAAALAVRDGGLELRNTGRDDVFGKGFGGLEVVLPGLRHAHFRQGELEEFTVDGVSHAVSSRSGAPREAVPVIVRPGAEARIEKLARAIRVYDPRFSGPPSQVATLLRAPGTHPFLRGDSPCRVEGHDLAPEQVLPVHGRTHIEGARFSALLEL